MEERERGVITTCYVISKLYKQIQNSVALAVKAPKFRCNGP